MLWKRVILTIALILFLILTVRAVLAHSYLGVIMMFSANPATELLSVDLILALSLVCIWMVLDARNKGNAYIPFLLITTFFGVAGPLLYLIMRDFSPKMQRIEAILVLIALGAFGALTYPVANLSDVKSEATNSQRQIKGRALMTQAAQAHGLDAWRKHKTVSLEGRDLWQAQGWWPEADQGLQLHFLTDSFTSQVLLTDGAGKGQHWGLQTWTPYRSEPGSPDFDVVTQPAPEISFYLPALQYFSELPFRLLQAEHLIYQGEKHHRGKTYDRILATWGKSQPDPNFDQYQVWINRETQLIEMVYYTVRDAANFATGFQQKMMQSLALGTIHFDDYRQVEGIWFPFAHTVTLQAPQLTRYPLNQHFFHRLEISNVQFDSVSPDALRPLPLDETPGDVKPQSPGRS